MQLIESDELIELIERAEAMQLRLAKIEAMLGKGAVEVRISARLVDSDGPWLPMTTHHGTNALDIVAGEIPMMKGMLSGPLSELATRSIQLSPVNLDLYHEDD